MAGVTIHSDFAAQENKIYHSFHLSMERDIQTMTPFWLWPSIAFCTYRTSMGATCPTRIWKDCFTGRQCTFSGKLFTCIISESSLPSLGKRGVHWNHTPTSGRWLESCKNLALGAGPYAGRRWTPLDPVDSWSRQPRVICRHSCLFHYDPTIVITSVKS